MLLKFTVEIVIFIFCIFSTDMYLSPRENAKNSAIFPMIFHSKVFTQSNVHQMQPSVSE